MVPLQLKQMLCDLDLTEILNGLSPQLELPTVYLNAFC